MSRREEGRDSHGVEVRIPKQEAGLQELGLRGKQTLRLQIHRCQQGLGCSRNPH